MAKHKGKAKAGAKAIGKGMLAAATFLAKRSTLYGVGAAYGEDMLAERSELVRTKWWAGPVAILGAAALMRKKEAAAKGLAGAAGYAGGLKYKAYQFQNGKADKSPIHNWDFQDKPDGAGAAKTPSPGAQGADDDVGLAQDSALYN